MGVGFRPEPEEVSGELGESILNFQPVESETGWHQKCPQIPEVCPEGKIPDPPLESVTPPYNAVLPDKIFLSVGASHYNFNTLLVGAPSQDLSLLRNSVARLLEISTWRMANASSV